MSSSSVELDGSEAVSIATQTASMLKQGKGVHTSSVEPRRVSTQRVATLTTLTGKYD